MPTPDVPYTNIPDEDKVTMIRELVKGMAPEFKQLLINEIASGNVAGETQVNVSSNAELVRIEFGQALKWFAIPKAHALQLGASLMEHAGARLQRVDLTKTDG
jgi:hypothetical protein